MEVKLAVPIILLALLTGATISLGETPKIEDEWVQDPSVNNDGANNGGNVTHEHALFFVVMNGTELSFLEQEYQVAARHVHLENNRSRIVHKHREGVTWQEFLDTLNASVEKKNNTTYCGEFKNQSYCGEAAVKLNGENVSNLEKEIQQDDKLVIILQPDHEEWLKKYENAQLPPAYSPREITGRQL